MEECSVYLTLAGIIGGNTMSATATIRTFVSEYCDASAVKSESAEVGVTVHGQELFFCNHHFRESADKLAAQGGVVTATKYVAPEPEPTPEPAHTYSAE